MNYIKRAFAIVAAALVTVSMFAQQTMVSGVVSDDAGEPVIGAVVFYEGTSVSAITDLDGKYSIKSMPGKTLVFSCFGMKEHRVDLQGQKTINATLKPESMSIEDAVVIGYGSTSRKDLTGSITSVKADELKKAGSSNVFGSLQGKVAGLNITSQSGEPGAGFQIKIRGNNSINAGTTPLFVIDGVQMDISSGEIATTSTTGQGTYDPLAFLNPSDIESIEVLKDASATAIYGAQGANGVVLITTKSGSSSMDKTIVTFDASVGIATMPKVIPMIGAQDYINYRFMRKDYGSEGYGYDTNDDLVADTPKIASNYQTYDWQDLLFRNGITQNYSLGLSAVVGKGTKISTSMSYLHQQGLIVNNDYNRITGRIKVDHPIGKKIMVGASVTYGRNVSNGAVSSGGGSLADKGLVQMIYLERPVALYTEKDVEYVNGFNSLLDTVSEETFKKTIYQRTQGNVYFNWDIIKGLTLRLSASGSVSDSDLKEFYSSHSRWGQSKNGYGVVKNVGTFNWNAAATLTYKKSWDKTHNFDVMLGGEMSQYSNDNFTIAGYNYEDQSTGAYNIGKAGVIESPAQSLTESARMSAFGRANYNYKSRYYATLNFRADGSSKFYAGNRVGYFPSVSLAWRINEEPWMASTKDWMDNFKLRLSAGISGNDRVSTYAALAQLGLNYYASGGNEIMGMAPTSSANPKLKWETTYQYNAGLDLNLFDYRLNFTADVYYKDTRDMLYLATLSAQSGYTTQWQNLGRVENKGIELSLSTHNIDKRNFKWSSNITFDLSRNKVVDIGGIEYTSLKIAGGAIGNDISRIIVGQPIGVGYGYVADGNYQIDDFIVRMKDKNGKPIGPELPSEIVTSATYDNFTYELREGVTSINSVTVRPGDRKYKDLPDKNGKHDGEITVDDRTVISNSNPDFTMGFGNNFTLWDFEISCFLEGVYGRDIMNEFKVRTEGGDQQAFNNLSKAAWYGRWTPENKSNTYSQILNQTYDYVSSYYVEDGSYLRIKTLSLAYNLPEKWCNAIKFNSLKVSFNVDNVWVFTKYSGIDPDVSSSSSLFPGLDRMSYPKPRTFTFGISASF